MTPSLTSCPASALTILTARNSSQIGVHLYTCIYCVQIQYVHVVLCVCVQVHTARAGFRAAVSDETSHSGLSRCRGAAQ